MGIHFLIVYLTLGFGTGIPRVGFSRTAPVPADTVPVAGAGIHRPVNSAVSYGTRGTTSTRGCIGIP
jgi:hypothetical protein